MYSTKTLLAAASLAVLTAAGLGTASAAPWDYHWDRHDWRVHERMEHRAFVNRWRVAEALRPEVAKGIRRVCTDQHYAGPCYARRGNGNTDRQN